MEILNSEQLRETYSKEYEKGTPVEYFKKQLEGVTQYYTKIRSEHESRVNKEGVTSQGWVGRVNYLDDLKSLEEDLKEYINQLERTSTPKKRPLKKTVASIIDNGEHSFIESKGLKYDDDKLDFTLLPWDSVEEVVKVLEMGAKKYARDNWKKVDDGKHRYLKALNRHLVAANKGEEIDPESGLSHYAHIACNALFLLHFSEDK